MPEPIKILLSRFDKVREMGTPGRWTALCPAHDDRTPSLSVSKRGDSIALHCHAGCATEDVLAAVGLSFTDLYPDRWRAAKEAAVTNKGKKAMGHIDPLALDWRVLKIAKSRLERGEILSVEDEARVELAKLRIRESAA